MSARDGKTKPAPQPEPEPEPEPEAGVQFATLEDSGPDDTKLVTVEQALRILHAPGAPSTLFGPRACRECGDGYPCRTIQLLDLGQTAPEDTQ